MPFLIVRPVASTYGPQRRIVSGRLRTRAAAAAVLSTYGEGAEIVEIPRARLRGLGQGAYLRGAGPDDYTLDAGPAATVAATERARLHAAWRQHVAHRPAEGWRDDYADDTVLATGRAVHHALAAARHAADGTGPFAAATEQERAAVVTHIVEHVTEGGMFDDMFAAPRRLRSQWAGASILPAARVRCGLLAPVRNGAPATTTTTTAFTEWADMTVGDPSWRN